MTNTTRTSETRGTEQSAAVHSFVHRIGWWAIVTVLLVLVFALVRAPKTLTAAIFGVSLGVLCVIFTKSFPGFTARRTRSITAGVTRKSREQLYRDLDRECAEEWAKGMLREFNREE
jgi:cell division protein FtsW (lipid II flippase)